MERKPGRPPVGPTVHIKLTPQLLERLDALARAWRVTRSEAIRRLLEKELLQI